MDCLIYFVAILIIGAFISKLRSYRKIGIDSKAVLITGCDTGIGYHTAQMLYEYGFTVFAGCLNTEGEGALKLKSVESQRLNVIPMDITNEMQIKSAVTKVEALLPDGENGLWALINNAGILVYGEYDWLTWAQCERQVNVNLLGTMRVTKAFLPLIKRKPGRIITLTSVNGLMAYPGISVYCATKFGLEGFSDALRLELEKLGVSVIIIEPGDYARLTNIMGLHKRNVDEMWDEMTEEQKREYGHYFRQYNDHIIKNYGITSPPSFADSPLMDDIGHAVTSVAPKRRYLSASFGFRTMFYVLLHLPSSICDFLIACLFKYVFGFEYNKSAGKS